MDYVYGEADREDLRPFVPADGRVIGSVGCGTAFWEGKLVAEGREVHGVDISPEAVEVARGRITSARVIDPGDRAPFPEASLDGLILADVIEHIPAAWQALADFARMVKPGGWVLISVPNMRQVGVFKIFVWQGEWHEHPEGIFDRTHLQVMTHRRLARWCEAAGLEVVRWLDRYDPRPGRRRLFRAVDALTFRLFHTWFMFQIQVVCRRKSPPAATAAG